MDREDKEKFNKLCEQVSEVHTTIFGAQQQGGLLREHKDLKKDVQHLKEFSYKLLGGLMLASFLFAFIWKLIIK